MIKCTFGKENFGPSSLKRSNRSSKERKDAGKPVGPKEEKGPVNLGEEAVPAHVVRVSSLSPQTL